MKTKIFLLFFTMVLWISLIGQTAPSGTGTSADPYKISTTDHLKWLSNLVMKETTAGAATVGKYFKLMNDINMTGIDFTPIGGWNSTTTNAPNRRFAGNFDGNDKTISNLTINKPDKNYIALFGYTSNAVIANLGITGAFTGADYVGGLIGNQGSGTVSNCSASGTVSAKGAGVAVGGLAGFQSGPMSNCYATVSVSATGTNAVVGGLVGFQNSTVSNSYATGEVSTLGIVAGGLIGHQNSGTISNCYATGAVSATGSGASIGGLVGYQNGGTAINCYYNGQTSGTNLTNAIGTPKTTSEMKAERMSVLLNNSQNPMIWYSDLSNVNNGYPVFRKQINGYIIIFNYQQDNNISSLVYQNNYTLNASPVTPTHLGYNFNGWYKDAACTIPWTFPITITSDMVFYAKWTEKGTQPFTFTQSVGGTISASYTYGNGTATEIIAGGAVPLDAVVTVWIQPDLGWLFVSAKKQEGDNVPTAIYASDLNNNYLIFTMASTTSFYDVIWKDTTKFTVTFNIDGVTVDSITDIVSGSSIARPPDSNNYNYTFVGWFKDAALTIPWNFATDVVTGNTTLYGKFVENIAKFNVNFKVDTVTVSTITDAVSGSIIAQPTNPEKQHYTFIGWFKDPELLIQWNFATDVVTGNTTLYGKFVENIAKFNVNFKVDTVTVSTITDAVSGSIIAQPTNPEKQHYTFIGWFKDPELLIQWNFATDVVIGNTTLYGKFVENIAKFNVNFTIDGVTVDSITNAVSGSIIAQPTNPEKQHYTFIGWFKDPELLIQWNFATDVVIGNTTLYGKFVENIAKFNVNFTIDGVTVDSITNAVSGSVIVQPTNPEKPNYTFVGWFKDPELLIQWNFATDVVIGNTTLYGKFVENIAKFNVNFTIDGVTVDSITNAVSGSVIVQPTNPEKPNYTFVGWFKDPELLVQWNFATDVVTGNTTLYGKFVENIAKFNVTFTVDGVTVSTITDIVSGNVIAQPTNPEKQNYTFVGWFKDPELIAPWNFPTDIVTNNMTLYGKFIENTVKLTVNFNIDGVITGSMTDILIRSSIIQPVNPEKANYTFVGWFKDPELLIQWNFSSDIVTGNTTLYGKFVENTAKLTVNFKVDGITVKSMTNISSGSSIVQPENPEKPNYTFVGWFKDSELIIPWNFTTDVVTGNTTLYGKFVENIAKFTVNFKVDGITISSAADILSGTSIAQPVNPEKPNYTFVGWFKDPELIIPWNFMTNVVTSNITLYAKFVENTTRFTVNFNVDGVIINSMTDIVAGTSIFQPSDPEKPNYTFSGWFKDINLTTQWDFTTDIVTENITLYAKWTSVVGIEKTNHGLKLYPNPATTILNVENSEQIDATTIDFFDITGNLMLEVPMTDVINISTLPQGIYSVRAGKFYGKIIKLEVSNEE